MSLNQVTILISTVKLPCSYRVTSPWEMDFSVLVMFFISKQKLFFIFLFYFCRKILFLLQKKIFCIFCLLFRFTVIFHFFGDENRKIEFHLLTVVLVFWVKTKLSLFFFWYIKYHDQYASIRRCFFLLERLNFSWGLVWLIYTPFRNSSRHIVNR